MRTALTLLCAAAACLSAAQDSFQGKLFSGNQLIGKAEFGLKAFKDGTFQGHITIENPDRKSTRTSTYNCDAAGRISLETVEVKGDSPGSKTISFDAAGVKVFALEGKKTHTFQLHYPKDAILSAPSRVWFIKIQPKKGVVSRYSVFDPGKLIWEQEEATYIGDDKLTYNGKTVIAHKVKYQDGTGWLDDHGILYKRTGKSGELIRDGVGP